MSLRRIWIDIKEIPGPIKLGDVFDLPHLTFHHAVEVSRFKVGDSFEGITGAEKALTLQVVGIEKKSARVKVSSMRTLPTVSRPNIHVAFAVSKWETTERVIEKSVELGVSVFQPLVSEYSFVKKNRRYPSTAA